MGLSVPALSTGIVASLPPGQAGMGSGLNSVARELGAALGVAVVGTLLTSHFTDALPMGLQEDADSTSQTLSGLLDLQRSSRACPVQRFASGVQDPHGGAS